MLTFCSRNLVKTVSLRQLYYNQKKQNMNICAHYGYIVKGVTTAEVMGGMM